MLPCMQQPRNYGKFIYWTYKNDLGVLVDSKFKKMLIVWLWPLKIWCDMDLHIKA